ncbi:hypothetical protein M413DRAFT_447164 [Hebeloma cylindrosporum]|uniref:F-box domain-containing protein n=1 Tax=Hebeloma cylindrosporum TaxID=76867 RepID=A0A0C3C6J0_HEBCY|nr:hypothetical protein M413DRAFT_447164 [Hebeloma cylindrosporum h7]
MAAIRHQIKQLEEEITNLEAKHNALTTTRNASHDPFIHKFPPEIGSHIFRLSLPKAITEYQVPEKHGRWSAVTAQWSAPLKLGSVCRSWRQIDPSMTDAMAEALPGLLREWLDRSGALPLAIYVFQESDPPFHASINTSTVALEIATGLVIDILNVHSGRWRNLYLTAGANICRRIFSSTKPERLVSLELSALSRDPIPMESELTPTHVKLNNFPWTSINVRWDNITHATLSNHVTIAEGLGLLRRAHVLEYYCISIYEPDNFEVIEPILHPRLRSLILSTSNLKKILDAIKLPSLEEWSHNGQLPVAAMLSFLKRSGCRIKVFNLDNIETPDEGLHNLLQEIPSLERIRLSFRSAFEAQVVMDDLLTQIFYSLPDSDNISGGDRAHDHESFLPHLQLIECRAKNFSAPFSWSYTPELYRDGHRRSLTLKTLARHSDMTDETALELLQLADEGADIQIRDMTMGGDFLENFRMDVKEA